MDTLWLPPHLDRVALDGLKCLGRISSEAKLGLASKRLGRVSSEVTLPPAPGCEMCGGPIGRLWKGRRGPKPRFCESCLSLRQRGLRSPPAPITCKICSGPINRVKGQRGPGPRTCSSCREKRGAAPRRLRRRRIDRGDLAKIVLIGNESPRSLRRFLESCATLKRRNGHTRSDCACAVAALSAYCACEVTLDQLSHPLLSRFVEWWSRDRGSARSSAHAYRSAIRSIWREAHRVGLVSTDPGARNHKGERVPWAQRPWVKKLRTDDPAVVLLENFCRRGRELRAFVKNVYWPRRKAFCKSTTFGDYSTASKKLCEFAGCEVIVDQLSEDLIERFAAWRLAQGQSAATVNKNITALCTLWRYAYRKRMVDDLPRDVAEVPELTRIPEAWTVDQFATLLDAASAQDPWTVCAAPASHFWRALLLVLYDTGLRITAVLKLSLSALDVSRRCLSVPAEVQKHKAAQALVLDPHTVELLCTLPREAGDERLLPVPWGGRERGGLPQLERWLKHILAAAGLPNGQRDLFQKIRRTNATCVANATGNDEAAQKQLGHSSVSLTRRNYIDTRLLDRRHDAASLIPRPVSPAQRVAIAAESIQEKTTTTGRAARGAPDRGFSNPK
jgi:integrase/recombinase XerC